MLIRMMWFRFLRRRPVSTDMAVVDESHIYPYAFIVVSVHLLLKYSD